VNSEEVWFSNREAIFQIKDARVEWTEDKKIWNWDRCTISMVKSPIVGKKLRMVVRSNANRNHITSDVNRPMTIRYMLGFDISNVGELHRESRNPKENCKNDAAAWTGPRDRWVFSLDEDYWIWDFDEDGGDAAPANVYNIYQDILRNLNGQDTDKKEQIFDLQPKSLSDKTVIDHLKAQAQGDIKPIVPVIYQPAVDGLKNFVREVHCHQTDHKDGHKDGWSEVEVTLVFNNERLRKHYFLDYFYKVFRSFRYNRDVDVETFKIWIDRKDFRNSYFLFEEICSFIDDENQGINQDSIHGDPAGEEIKRYISYYFVDYNHPVLFINTSNHAMAQHDANPMLWKWEYVPGVIDSPVSLGNQTRDQINARYDSSKDERIE
jgi:hypothetical protein